MASSQDNISMALFCDFENVALGVRDANYERFDIKRVLERLLLKGSIVVKKAYCDWDRYKAFKGTMHEANFELIEIPHVRQSGKNSADIRLVVDALDLCYTKSHVNTFVIISGDSDFSPLVSKLRENAKHVIGVGVKQSTSDLLIANCDEFIFYDDLVRESQRQAARRDSRDNPQQQAPRRSPEEEKRRRDEMDKRRAKIIDLAVETYEALVTDRDDGGRIWASVLKEALKRRNPGFSESYYGFKTFGNLLEEAKARGLLEFGRDEKSGTFVYRAPAGAGVADVSQPLHASHPVPTDTADEVMEAEASGAGPSASGEAAAERTPQRAPERSSAERGQERGRDRDRGRGRSRGGRDRDRERPEAADTSEGGPSAVLAPDLPGNAALDAVAASSAFGTARAPAVSPEPAFAQPAPAPQAPADEPVPAEGVAPATPGGRGRGSRKTAPRKTSSRARGAATAGAGEPPPAEAPAPAPANSTVSEPAPAGGNEKTARPRRTRKPKSSEGSEGSNGNGNAGA